VRRAAALAPILLTLGAATPLAAHEVRPGYLELREVGADRFEVLFKVPASGDARLGIYAALPEHCEERGPRARYPSPGALTERWSVSCAGGLTGHAIAIDGLAATLTDVLVRVERADGTAQIARLTPSAPSFVVVASPSLVNVAGTYLRLGIEHMLLGIDHLLFVLALLILVQGRRRLVGTISAFTGAHSVTLAAATLGLVRVPQQPVEAVIALSIAFVAAEIVRQRAGRPGLTAERPWIAAFAFGLLHGFGFAGALREVGLPEQSIPAALLFFNVGVELGQLAFVACALALAVTARRLALPHPAWLWRLPAYGIGSVAAYWTVDRVAGFY